MHFFYCLLFIAGSIAALWQHSSPSYTFTILFLLLPFSFALFIPYRFADTWTRQIIACAIFFGACFWISFRIKKQIPFDLALVEGLIAGSMAFLINNTKKDYHYLFFTSLFLLIYAGLVPRKMLLYLAPAAVVFVFILLSGDRLVFLSGERRVITSPKYSSLRSFCRSWHIRLFQILLAVPVFLYIFSLLPLHDTGSEGFFEVSFMTARTSILPRDLKKWLGQDKKSTIHKDGEDTVTGKEKPTASGNSGEKNISSPLPGKADGNGQGTSPGKELLFTVSMPVKLYHLATLYDIYDGKKWQTSPSLAKTVSGERFTRKGIYTFSITSKYTLHKWVSTNLYAPFRPMDYQFGIQQDPANDLLRFGKYMRYLEQTSFNAKFASRDNLPPLPFRYSVSSNLLIPLLPEEKEDAEGQKDKHLKIHTSAEDIFSVQTEKEKKRLAELLAEQKKKSTGKQEKTAAKKNISPPVRKTGPVVLRHDPPVKQPPVITGSGEKIRKAKLIAGNSYRLNRPEVLTYAPERPAERYFYRRKHTEDPAWQERMPKKHFQQLPETLSTRVTGLAGIITREKNTPYEKAIALRDYLRNNYKYRLDAAPAPEDQESVEYFLFELKEGHCEYFAAALTVLARACGLPARVAVGFSPGNYNALTKLFEVHEYHAHAWSQIFIANTGWLTFDAVPPGNMISETLPAGLGLLRDPFGEEWKITPPELTQTTLSYVKNTLLKEYMQEKSDHIRQTVSKIIQDDDALKEKKSTKGKKGKNAVKTTRKKNAGVRERLKNFFLYFTGKTGKQLLNFLASAKGKTFSIVFLIFLASLFFFFRDILAYGRILFLRYRFSRHIRMAEEAKETGAEKSILHLYRALRILLILAGMSRKHNHELLAYGAETADMYLAAWQKKPSRLKDERKKAEEKSRIFSGGIKQVFSVFYSLEYGERTFSGKEVTGYYECVKNTFMLLRELYPDGLFFLEKLLFSSPFSGKKM